MDDDVLSAFTAALGMMRWRLDLLEAAVVSELEGNPDSRLAEALDPVRKFRVQGALARRLLEEGYAARRAEEQAGRKAPPARGGVLRALPSRRPPAA